MKKEGQENSENLSQRNILLAERMRKLWQVGNNSPLQPPFSRALGHIWESFDGRFAGVQLENRKPQFFHKLVKVMGLPVVRFWKGDNNYLGIVTTPYGPLPQRVVDPEGKAWGFRNSFYFNFTGQAIKVESMSYLGNPDADYPTISFFPDHRRKDRFANLTADDYEKIEFFLTGIESGRMHPATFRASPHNLN